MKKIKMWIEININIIIMIEIIGNWTQYRRVVNQYFAEVCTGYLKF